MTSTCDFHDEFGDILEILPCGLRSYGGKTEFEGVVETVKCFEDNSRIKELSKTPGEGKVLVVDAAQSLRIAVLGDMVAGDMVANGWAGVVIWGAIRDVTQTAALNLGVLSLGHIPRRCQRRGEGQIGIDIQLGDANISPGDFLVSDRDGTVIFPKNGPQPRIFRPGTTDIT